MKFRFPVLLGLALFASHPSRAQRVEEVKAASSDVPALPEDLFRLPPGAWAFGRQLWKGDDPCAADACEGGYTSGDLVLSVERNKAYVRIVAGFRGCQSVAWNEYEIGSKASGGDTSTLARLVKKTVGTSAKYCKVPAPAVPKLDARQLFPVQAQSAQ